MNEIKIDKLIKSKRKTVALQIGSKGELIVRVPYHAKLNDIKQIVAEKSKWILKMQESARLKKKKIIENKYIDGEVFLCFGKEFKLKFSENMTYALSSDDENIIISLKFKQYSRQLLVHWYKRQAKRIISLRTEFLSNQAKIRFNVVKITNAKTRWASCSSRGNLNFTWRLALAPPDVLDYIIVHELAHTYEMNHSKKFWNIVEQLLPDYMLQEKWLKANNHVLEYLDG